MNLDLIKELRSRTGCGIVDCREALQEARQEVEEAINILRKKGIVKAAKKADRATHEGFISSYIHTNGKIGVLVSLQCETDFVAKNDKFRKLANNIALHIAAMDPSAISPADISAAEVAREEQIAKAQAAESGKPAEIRQKMVLGKMNKFREERALLTQPFVKEPDKTIADLIKAAIQELGENIVIANFSRLSI